MTPFVIGQIVYLCTILENGDITNCRQAEIKARPYVVELNKPEPQPLEIPNR